MLDKFGTAVAAVGIISLFFFPPLGLVLLFIGFLFMKNDQGDDINGKTWWCTLWRRILCFVFLSTSRISFNVFGFSS